MFSQCVVISVSCKLQYTIFCRTLFSRPNASEVLTAYLMQCNEPPWTSYFVKVSLSIFDPGLRSDDDY